MQFIYSKGKTYGPFKAEQLSETIKEGRVPFSAWVYDGENWRLLAEDADLRALHPEFEAAPTQKPSAKTAEKKIAAPAPAAASFGSGATSGIVSADPIWFVIRDKKKYGPYSGADIVGQLQKKEIDSTHYVWRPGFATWQKIASIGEFSKQVIKHLSTQSESMDILVKRKFPRTPYDVEVIAHDNAKAIQGKTMVIGEGGLFLSTDRVTHKIGARLKLHFRASDLQPFNAVAEIVSVVRGDGAGYCLKFVAISEVDRKRIAKFVSERSSR